MTDLLFDIPANSSFLDVIYLYWNTINVYLFDAILLLRNNKNKNILPIFDTLPESLNFDEFQYSLLKAFLLILFTNLFLIFITWKVYGKRICDRFMKPGKS